MELPPDAYVLDGSKDIFALRGNKYNTEGMPAVVEVNQYRMKKFDFKSKIYQYDVSCWCYPHYIKLLANQMVLYR